MAEGTGNLLQSAFSQILDLLQCPDGKPLKLRHKLLEVSEIARTKSKDLGGGDFVSVCDSEHGEAADGSAEGSVCDAYVKQDCEQKRRDSGLLLHIKRAVREDRPHEVYGR